MQIATNKNICCCHVSVISVPKRGKVTERNLNGITFHRMLKFVLSNK